MKGSHFNSKLKQANAVDRCRRGLCNVVLYANQTCDECGCFLKNSNWRNVNVFESTNHSWVDGFLCVRCSTISRKSFDKFVKPFVKTEVTRKLTQNCRRNKHELCQMGDCGVCICECHYTGGVK